MPTQPSGRPPGGPNSARLNTRVTFRQDFADPNKITARANNRQLQTHQNKHSRRKQQRSQNIRKVEHQAATNKTNSRRATSILEEHKQEFQPVHKVWMALQPSQEWRQHQAKLRHSHFMNAMEQTRIGMEETWRQQQEMAQDIKALLRHSECLAQQAKQRQAKPASRSVPFQKIGGLLFTIWGDSELAEWERVHTQRSRQRPYNIDAACTGHGTTSAEVGQHSSVRNSSSVGTDDTAFNSWDRIAWRTNAPMLEIRRRASRWRFATRYRGMHTCGPVGKVNALRCVYTRWRHCSSRFSPSALHDAIVRASTRWRGTGGHDELHMDVVRRYTRWKSWFGGNDLLTDKGAYGRRIKMIVVVGNKRSRE